MKTIALLPSVAIIASVLHPSATADEALRRKIAQMVVVGFNGTTVVDSLRVDLSQRNLGGVILLGRNCISPSQIQQLNSQVRSLAATPPLIAVDQEGGVVARLNENNGYAATQSAYTLGTVWNSLDSTAAQAARMAAWLNAGGFTTNLAPVVDVNVNPSSPGIGQYGRSFSRIPLAVANHARRFIDEFHAQHVMTTLKHFPGHGSATSDSHFSLPDITRTWADSELIPYRELLATNSVDIVMTGHLYNANIDSVYPSSLSHNTITHLLRDSLHYNGVVITDDLYNMAAITARYGFGTAARLAINAGTDILLYVWNLRNGSSLCKAVVDTIEEQVLGGAIPLARIDESYARIMQLKSRYLSTEVEGGRIASTNRPEIFSLSNYPNPFNPFTTISYTLSARGHVVLEVYNTLGQLAARLVDGDQLAGTHTVFLDGSTIAGGVYFCRLTVGPRAETRKLLLLK